MYSLYYNPLNYTIPTNAENDNCFKAWLSKVANNELKGLLKDYFGTEKQLDADSNELPFESEEIEEHLADGINTKLLKEALNTLSERDRRILMTYYNYYEEDKNTPSSVLDELCKIHGTTKPNIRKIRERGEKKIVAYFAKHSNLIPLKHVK